jgi:WhiB family transcriptional regulator, redox-sensing transcriptional regulator
MQWLDRARCLGEDPELFFPVGSTGAALEQVEDAKAVCGRCTVRPECLQWALDTAQDAGVWGGMSEDERRSIRRARRREQRAARQASGGRFEGPAGGGAGDGATVAVGG